MDPISWAQPLSERDVVLQVAIHDEQVPNFASDSLARSAGLQVLRPEVSLPSDLTAAKGPLTRGYVQFDPQKPPAPEANRPAPVTDAHTDPRDWTGQRQQVTHYLRTGRLEHFCGGSPCSASNPGGDP